jgi:hypothetical protein
VFLSYSSKDKTWADAACSVLERRRVRCWIAPRDITPGEEWGAAIVKGINRSRILVLIFSGHANASPQVRREVERAISRGMCVLPVRIENVLPDGAMEYALGNSHWLDAFTPPMERQLELLARSVKTLLGNDVPAVAEVAEPTRLPLSERAKLWSRRNRTAVRIAVAAALMFVCISTVLGTLSLTGPRGWLEKKPEGSVQPEPGRPKQTKPRESPPSAADAVATDGFVQLFNGKDMTGWKLIGPPEHSWKVVGGILEGRGPFPGSTLVTERTDFANFHLRVDTMMPEGLQNAIKFRITATNGQPSSYYATPIAGTVELPNERGTKTGRLQFVSAPK